MNNRSLLFGRSLLAFLLLTTALFAQIPPNPTIPPLAGNYTICDSSGVPLSGGAFTVEIKRGLPTYGYVGTVKNNGVEMPNEEMAIWMTSGGIGFFENAAGNTGTITWTANGWQTEMTSGPNRGLIRLLTPIVD